MTNMTPDELTALDKMLPLSGWRRVAYIWAHNLTYWSGDDGSGWTPVGSNDLGKALVEAADEVAKLEQAVRELGAVFHSVTITDDGNVNVELGEVSFAAYEVSDETRQILRELR